MDDNKAKSVLSFLKAVAEEPLFRDQFCNDVSPEKKARYTESMNDFIEAVKNAKDEQSLIEALREKFDPENLKELERMLGRDLRKNEQ